MDLNKDTLSIVYNKLDIKNAIRASMTCKRWMYYFHSYLKHASIDLCDTHIDNAGLAYLKCVHSISLWNSQKITDAGLAHLKGVHTINLNICNQITDA
jgi:hypothetical protein